MTMTDNRRPSFGVALREACHRFGPVCVGIDPHDSLLETWGLPLSATGVHDFAALCYEAFAGTVAMVKPQVAFFERYGADGYHVLEELITAFRGTGTLVCVDAKRGDIGSTNAGYARAWLNPQSPLCGDSLTISPYLGVGALQPFFDEAEESGAGLFVLARTSNSEGEQIQKALIHPGQNGEPMTVAQSIIEDITVRNAPHVDQEGIGPYGIVLGATVQNPPDLSRFAGPVLLPGVGAQGGTIETAKALLHGSPALGISSVSRAVLGVGPDPQALAHVARDLNSEFFC